MTGVTVSPFEDASVRGFLHRQPQANGQNFVLTHGAGGNCRAPLLVAVATAFCGVGYWVLRCDLPFRQRRPFGPPSPHAAAEDRAGLKAAVAVMRRLNAGRAFLGGHSYGGRQASVLAADERECCDGLLLLSYPLHPPDKPNQLRTAHFPSLQTPALFVHGTTDPFASVDELRSALQLIPARTELVSISGAGHDLARGNFDIEKVIVNRFSQLIEATVPGQNTCC